MSKISENTLVPISAIAVVLATATGGAWWMSALYSRVARAEENVMILQGSQKEIVDQLKTVNENLIEIKTVLKGVK